MKSKLFVVLAAFSILGSLAYAQYTDGVEQENDKFTGETSCYQFVSNSPSDESGIIILNDNAGVTLTVVRHIQNRYKTAFNFYGKVGSEKVYFMFAPGDVITMIPSEVSGIVESRYEFALFLNMPELTNKILSAPQDIEIRFAGPEGNQDFMISHEVVLELAKGYGQTCL